MTTLVRYHPRNIEVDLAVDCPTWLYNEIVSLRGHISRKDPPVLTCLGNGQPLYVYRHESGRYFASHYTGGNPDGHSHHIARMSDEHRREAEYARRAAASQGLDAKLEHSTGNHTRLDLAVFGHCNVGIEVQRSQLSRAQAKRRAALSFEAGWPTAWISDREDDPDWIDHVPSARLTVRGWDCVPPPNTVNVIISRFTRERDKTRKTGWRYVREPFTVLLDELAYLIPAGEIVPVTVGKFGVVVLADKTAPELIDSCTYPGASLWKPTMGTPRHKEAAQTISRECRHGGTREDGGYIPPAQTIVTTSAVNEPAVWRRPDDWPSEDFVASISHYPGRCKLCAFHIPTQGHRKGCPR